MQSMPKDYNFAEIESKWQSRWEEMKLYHYDWNDKTREPFSIDTPPPYPSGELHMGNVLNWTYFDIVARFKRMQGYNVLFPQGWDCHGLGIEIQVEKANNIRKRDIPSDQFRTMCMALVEKYIAMMKEGILKLGSSIDWTTEYRTMDSNYWRCTQLSFIQLYQKGYMYQGTHPVNWCPRDETAIADAEVDHVKKEGVLHYIKFSLVDSDEYILIATSRPEFIPACVAVKVNPNDERYGKFVGKKIRVPLVNREVIVIADEAVDMSFGTGAVQICTYGDKDDVKTVIKHKLPVICLISENGRVTEAGCKYAGLYLNQARTAVVADLAELGLLEKTEKIQQEVGVCERCKTHVEVLERKQWFMKTMKLSETVEANANEISWYPDYMKNRLIDWAKSLDWDWVISRQRLFATPIPVWYCRDCGEIIVAKPEWVPIDPKLEGPRIDVCPKCGCNVFSGEQDVMDTWMDSSITCAVHAGWPDRSDWKRLFPANMHPSGTDIIRTWAYYLMVRHLALFDERPFNSVLINGMVLGADGRKMSKSLKNYAAAPETLAKNGADAVRQWAAGGGATGSDIPYRVQDVEYGKRFLNKLWNASVFASKLLEDYSPKHIDNAELQLLDQWIISKTENLVKRVTSAFEKCQFNIALEDIRNFTWHILCDYYIEAIKDRLYRPEIHGKQSRIAAQYTIHEVLYRLLQLFAPVAPHITEEIYQYMYSNSKGYKSIQISEWPKFNPALVSDDIEKQGDLIIAVLGEIRNDKAQNKLSLNTPIKNVTVYAGDTETATIIQKGTSDIISTLKIENFKVTPNKSTQGRQVTLTDVYIQTEY
ncbi:MAG: valine--tRNA ligase [Candidatus Bathyarchaeota archaeon]|uniref:valine--tRNA ligase n=2 Tax=Candidatus Bathycorpusculum sp. TaxID=2994959 RepID=UPI002832D78E|nr:valine--tRNA ligase [Candidatus Termiticorpusculum sp.]MCL2291770.1 valine--tRNA ligase [Candidatus Termiticorpusculum sp.]